jgi:hypothetical protein
MPPADDFIAKSPKWALKSQKTPQNTPGAGQKEVEPDTPPLEPKWGVQGLCPPPAPLTSQPRHPPAKAPTSQGSHQGTHQCTCASLYIVRSQKFSWPRRWQCEWRHRHNAINPALWLALSSLALSPSALSAPRRPPTRPTTNGPPTWDLGLGPGTWHQPPTTTKLGLRAAGPLRRSTHFWGWPAAQKAKSRA